MSAPFKDHGGLARNPFVVRDDGCVLMALTQGHHTLLDVADFDLVAPYRWFASVSAHAPSKIYARAKLRGASVWMHKLILSIGKGQLGDHRDGRTLNNRRYNLRLADTVGNAANRRCPVARSGYRGVHHVDKGGSNRWQARVSCRGRNVYVGSYDTPIEAARAYDRACFEFHGEFGVFNFPAEILSLPLAGDPSLSTAVDRLPALRIPSTTDARR